MTRYLVQTFELPPRSKDRENHRLGFDSPKGYELAGPPAATHGTLVVSWVERTRPEPVYCWGYRNTNPFSVSVIRKDHADGNREVLMPGASVELHDGDYICPFDKSTVWRGSTSDLATDLSAMLSTEELQELTLEMAALWQKRKHDL